MKEHREAKEKKDSTSKSKDSSDALTSSEKRSLEKKKKEEQRKMVEEAKSNEAASVASSNYYRSKKDSTEEGKEEQGAREDKVEEERNKAPGRLNESSTSSSSIRKSSKSGESEEGRKKNQEPEETIEEKKKKLLEKVREKKEVTKSDGSRTEKRVDVSSMIGKIPKKKRPTATGRDPADMNNDYSYYQQNYIYNYGYDIYTAAYYAQYMMVTSGDYSQEEIKRWLLGNGYEYDHTTGQEMPQLPPTESCKEGQQTNPESDSQPIAVVVPNVPAAAHEMYYQSPQSDSMDVDSEEEGGVTPPPPPPPPPGPQITTLTVTQPFSLPDGTNVPSGTKQVIVHPYSDTHPFASEFTPDAIKSKIQNMKQLSEGNSNGVSS